MITNEQLKKSYSALVKKGTLLVCPISGISFTVPDFGALGKIYMDNRHPLGVESNYPEIFNNYHLFPRLSESELAGIILTTLKLYGSFKSPLSSFKQNELLIKTVDYRDLLAFIDFLRAEFVGRTYVSSSFTLTEEFNSLYLFSFQKTCRDIKLNIGFDTLTVSEAIEQKQLLVGGRDTIRSMTIDIKNFFKEEILPYISEESGNRALELIGPALVAPSDKDITKITEALTKKLSEGANVFNKELWRYRAYFERKHLIQNEDILDLDFTSNETPIINDSNIESDVEKETVVETLTPVTTEQVTQDETTQRKCDQQEQPNSQHCSSQSESISARIARIRASLGSR